MARANTKINSSKYSNKKKNNLLQKIFSVTNGDNHKVITVFNIKIKFTKKILNIEAYRERKVKKIYEYLDRYIFNPEKWQFIFCDCYISRKKLWRGIKSKAPLLNGSIIDIGCGRKPYEELFINCTKYEGLDYATPDINFEFERHADYYYDGITFPFNKDSYDNAVCFQCLEHVPDPNHFLEEINRVIKPGGYLLLTCPFSFAQHFHPYDYFRFSSFGLKKLLEDTNFEVVEIKPLETSAETLAGNFLYFITSHIKYYSIFRIIFCLFYNIFSPLIYKLFPKDYEYTTDYLVLAKKKKIIKNSSLEDYNTDFYASFDSDFAMTSAENIINVVKQYYMPNSVIDIGCGNGIFLNAWQNNGVKTIKGVDANNLSNENLFVDRNIIEQADLENYTNITKERYDLAMSLEVAEHISKEKAKQFVDTLCSFSDFILFSAAIPYQDGTNHINCQPLDYWVNLFKEKNYICFDFIRPQLFDKHREIYSWYLQNILFFVKADKKEIFEEKGLTPTDSPFMFYHNAHMQSVVQQLKKDKYYFTNNGLE